MCLKFRVESHTGIMVSYGGDMVVEYFRMRQGLIFIAFSLIKEFSK